MTAYEQVTSTLKAMQHRAKNLQEAVDILLAGRPTRSVSYLSAGSNRLRFRLSAEDEGWVLAQENPTIPQSVFHTRGAPDNLKYWLAPTHQYQFADRLHELLAYQIRDEEEYVLQVLQQGAQFFGFLQPDITIDQLYIPNGRRPSGRRTLLEDLRPFSLSAQQKLLDRVNAVLGRGAQLLDQNFERDHFHRLNPEEVSRILKALEDMQVHCKRHQEWLENEQAELLKLRQFYEA